ncbi:uncharacterized protein LOC125422846 [Ziziphus jujuba]|uniref:Uncharacterized protein LOC125422846 n=1 Tax=Ziziphus jujuba TaxID=326968 RepID=A0ABM3ILF2_ZIZJJ|nr:uncharacterized protein LOC125422846 [Ziziphus jujuba]
MGSLMAGWDSPVLDSKSAACMRNRSFTKEEIEAYWKSKQKTIEEHLKEISSPRSDVNQQEDVVMETGKRFQRSSSLPLNNTKQVIKEEDDDGETSFAALVNKNGWWTRSSWAFLNEPPLPEVASNSYVPQFNVVRVASSKG